ncbi:MAG: hypothetical protein LBE85_04280 [Candidatus Accumulibacter sp.]|nr:hypothetical protein [Accumulibacter sp.]
MRLSPVSLLLFCAWLLFAGADALAFEVVAAEFGLFDASDPQRVVFAPAAVVPRREGQRYGWMIELKDAPRSVGVREEYLLPNRAAEARTESATGTMLLIPAERRNQVSQRQLVPVDGRIFGEWSVGPREPPGPRRLEVIVEGRVAADFEFEMR